MHRVYTSIWIVIARVILDSRLKELAEQEQKRREIEDKAPIIQTDALKFLTNGSLDEMLQAKTLEPFFTYEPKRKIEDIIIM